MSEIQSVSAEKLAELDAEGSVDLIDVRTPVEFREVHAAIARNIPLDSLDPSRVMGERNGTAGEPLYVICRSGSRSSKACQKFVDAGFENIVNVEGGTNAWDAAGLPVNRGKKAISLERQVRIVAGMITLIGAVAALATGNVYWAAIPAFIGAGLTFAGITDTCGMGMVLARMPWNQCENRVMFGLAILFGSVVGFALGLTGGGGGVFAVPLLVYGLSVAPREAVGVSLASVGGTALFGITPRLVRGEVELRTGVLFAVAGMLGAPLGNYLSGMISENVLLLMFGILMFVVAWRMWAKTRQTETAASEITVETCEPSTCQRDEDGKLRLTSKCAILLAAVGLMTGILSGMFGVGGGFVIVPALVLFSGMKIHQAVATSLLVIVLVSLSGVTSYIALGNDLSWQIVLLFLFGGFAGMWIGGLVAKRLRGPVLQKVFAAGVVLVALFVISKSILLT